MPRRESYVPKHRGPLAEPTLKKGIRKSVLFSGVAVAATGIAVSSGILMKSEGPGNAASAALASANLGQRPPLRRRAGRRSPPPARRPPRHRVALGPPHHGRRRQGLGTQPGLGRPGHRDRGPHQPGPAHHRPGDAPGLRLRQRPVLLPRLALRERERLERARGQPVVLRLRHPSGAPGLEDGHGRLGLGRTTRPPRSAGASATSRAATAPRAAPGPSSRATTGTEQPFLATTTGGSCSPRRAPRRAASRSGRPSRRTPARERPHGWSSPPPAPAWRPWRRSRSRCSG